MPAMSGLCQVGELCLKGQEVFYPGSTFFIDPEGMADLQLVFVFLVYGYVLFVSANMIGDGAELLLLVPEYAGMVGSIVLPILGAIPDGMMVLFSGVGPLEVAQENVAVGVGALAGSTIMLLTLPWVLAVKAGQVDMDAQGNLVGYKQKAGKRLTGTMRSGIEFKEGVTKNAYLMFITSLSYFVIQIPAYMVDDQKTKKDYPSEAAYLHAVREESAFENVYAMFGIVATGFFFLFYMYLQYLAATPSAKVPGFLKPLLPPPPATADLDNVKKFGCTALIEHYRQNWKQFKKLRVSDVEVSQPYADNEAPMMKAKRLPQDITDVLKGLYQEYAKKTGEPGLHGSHLRELLSVIGLTYTPKIFEKMFAQADADKSDFLDQGEFLCFFYDIVTGSDPLPYESKQEAVANEASGGNDDEEEEDEMPDEFKDLPPDEQRRQIISSSVKQMVLGTLLVLIFSDPMVDVLAEIGKKTGIPAFYVSFVLAPLASNASELVSSMTLASKKTSQAMTQSLQTLEGAACMNNTFCLGIFYVLIYKQGLAWKFTAETMSIFFVQFLIFLLVIRGTKQTMTEGYIIFGCYPIALVFVAALEAMGFD